MKSNRWKSWLIFELIKVWICYSCTIHAGVRSALTVTPENLAVESGADVTMRCESDISPSSNIFWRRLIDGITSTVCACGGGIPIYPFNCVSSNTMSCDLFIQNISLTLADIYSCTTYGTEQTTYSAQLIVLETTPECKTSPSGRVNVTDSVEMSCSVTYTGDLAPVMTWFNSMGQQLISTNQSTSGSADYVTSVSAEIPVVLPHTCKTNFTSSSSDVGSGVNASNIPSYTSTCYTQNITTQYAPFTENITIQGLDEDLYLGSVLLCNGNAEPGVFYYNWTDNKGETVGNNYTLSLDKSGENLTYICTVCNLLGCNHTEIIINVIPELAPTTQVTTTVPIPTSGTGPTVTAGPPTTKDPNGGSNTALIVGAVIGGLAAAIIVVILVICFVRESCPINKKILKTRKEKDEQSREDLTSRSDNFNDINSMLKLDAVQVRANAIHYTEIKFGSILRQRRPGECDGLFDYIDDNDNLITYDQEYKFVYSTVQRR